MQQPRTYTVKASYAAHAPFFRSAIIDYVGRKPVRDRIGASGGFFGCWLTWKCSRDQADEIRAKLAELQIKITVEGPPKIARRTMPTKKAADERSAVPRGRRA
jgi:hypothetical protein